LLQNCAKTHLNESVISKEVSGVIEKNGLAVVRGNRERGMEEEGTDGGK
jgi:hypothetical protein